MRGSVNERQRQWEAETVSGCFRALSPRGWWQHGLGHAVLLRVCRILDDGSMQECNSRDQLCSTGGVVWVTLLLLCRWLHCLSLHCLSLRYLSLLPLTALPLTALSLTAASTITVHCCRFPQQRDGDLPSPASSMHSTPRLDCVWLAVCGDCGNFEIPGLLGQGIYIYSIESR